MTEIQFQTALIDQEKKLMFYAMRLTSDTNNARDLLQETFLKALIYSDKFTQNTNFNAWIYTIMKNTFINNYHRKINEKNTIEAPINNFHLNNEKDKGNPTPESIYNSKEIILFINALDEEYKTPFNMFLEGYKYKEIAEELNLPLGTIKSRIFFTRKKLEKSLKAYIH
jgi:RNA polymerase sigma-70 factor (ECF subfamily)